MTLEHRPITPAERSLRLANIRTMLGLTNDPAVRARLRQMLDAELLACFDDADAGAAT
jgi:hypothetical protein